MDIGVVYDGYSVHCSPSWHGRRLCSWGRCWLLMNSGIQSGNLLYVHRKDELNRMAHVSATSRGHLTRAVSCERAAHGLSIDKDCLVYSLRFTLDPEDFAKTNSVSSLDNCEYFTGAREERRYPALVLNQHYLDKRYAKGPVDLVRPERTLPHSSLWSCRKMDTHLTTF